jgi:hypothetical protein
MNISRKGAKPSRKDANKGEFRFAPRRLGFAPLRETLFHQTYTGFDIVSGLI